MHVIVGIFDDQFGKHRTLLGYGDACADFQTVTVDRTLPRAGVKQAITAGTLPRTDRIMSG